MGYFKINRQKRANGTRITSVLFTSLLIKSPTKITAMKNLIFCVLASCSIFVHAQEELVNYTIPFGKDIVDCAVYTFAADNPKEEVGRIESIIDSKISLQLSPERDYRVLVNNTDLIFISREDIARIGEENKFRQNFQNQEGLFFTIQIGAFKDIYPTDLIEAHEDLMVDDSSDKNLRRYMLGTHTSVDAVLSALENLKQTGFPDAFPVAYKDGERINFTEAKNTLDQASK